MNGILWAIASGWLLIFAGVGLIALAIVGLFGYLALCLLARFWGWPWQRHKRS